jgi:hypothetical protein
MIKTGLQFRSAIWSRHLSEFHPRSEAYSRESVGENEVTTCDERKITLEHRIALHLLLNSGPEMVFGGRQLVSTNRCSFDRHELW